MSSYDTVRAMMDAKVKAAENELVLAVEQWGMPDEFPEGDRGFDALLALVASLGKTPALFEKFKAAVKAHEADYEFEMVASNGGDYCTKCGSGDLNETPQSRRFDLHCRKCGHMFAATDKQP